MRMKTGKYVLRLIILLIAGGLALYSCKKDNSNTGTNNKSLTSQQSIQVQNSDAQDALADKTEQDIDNKLDELQNNNYNVAAGKSLSALTDTVVITVDHPDTTTFPKVVTLTYYNFRDSSAFENIVKNGQITVTITSANPYFRKLISRAFVFNNFSVTTDSTMVLLNGTRNVDRMNASLKFNGMQTLRLAVTDQINASTTWAVVTTGKTDTLKFTRNVNKLRTGIYHFRNIIYRPLDPIHFLWRFVASSDTITYTGTVTGLDEKGDTYSKSITSPLQVVVYRGSLVIASGALTFVDGTESYQVEFEVDPAHPHYTRVTVTNNLTGKTISFDRRFGRIFRRWW